MAWGTFGDPSAWTGPQEASSRPPLASPGDELARATVNSCARELQGFDELSHLQEKIRSMGGTIYRGFGTYA
jgi:hypothetical protein